MELMAASKSKGLAVFQVSRSSEGLDLKRVFNCDFMISDPVAIMTGGAVGAAAGLGFTSFAFPANDTTAPMIAPKITNMHVNKIAYLFVHPAPFL